MYGSEECLLNGDVGKMYTRVYVEITNACNMKCSFCHGHKRPIRFMKEAEFLRVLDELRGKTEYVYYHLMGEPLLHPDLPRFLSLAKEHGYRSVLTTNGTLLHARKETLLNAGLHKVSISVHSLEDEREEVRLRYLDEITEFATRAAEHGVIVVFRLWNRGCDNGLNQFVIDELHRRFPIEWVENTRGIRIGDKIYVEWGDRFIWPDRDAPIRGEKVFCYGMGDHFGILCDGTVVPCCLDSDGVVNLGNVLESPLDEILSSKRAVSIRQGFQRRIAKEELCKRCSYAQRFSR